METVGSTSFVFNSLVPYIVVRGGSTLFAHTDLTHSTARLIICSGTLGFSYLTCFLGAVSN